MKRKLMLPGLKMITAFCVGIILFSNQPVAASGKPYRTFSAVNSNTEKDRSLFSRKKNSIKIYLDAPKKKVHVKAKENKGKEIDFFVFDLDGTLVHNHKMKTRDHIRINNLSKGVYVYRVFLGDEETASGQFEIK